MAVKPVDEHFSCTICLNVAFDPKECAQCSKLNCTTCLTDWFKKNDTCPNCRNKYGSKWTKGIIMMVVMIAIWPTRYAGIRVGEADIPGHSRRGPKGYNQRSEID